MDQSTIPLISCPHCAAQMPETAGYCPGCGRAMQRPQQPEAVEAEEPRARGTVGRLPEGLAGALAYLTFIPALVFLFVEPYRKNRFTRFHSLQCLFLWAAGILIAIALKVASYILFLIPVVGPLLLTLLAVVLVIAGFVIWAVLVIKALQGQMFRLPILGDLAELNTGLADPPSAGSA